MKNGLWKKGIVSLLALAIFLAPVTGNFRKNEAMADNTDKNLIVNYNNTSVIVDVYIDPLRLEDNTDYSLSVFLFDGDQIPDPNTLPSSGLEALQFKDQGGITKEKATADAKLTIAQTITFQNLTPKHNYYLLVNIVEDTLWKSAVGLVSKTPNAFVIPVNLAKGLMGIFGADFTQQKVPYKVTKTFSTSDTTTYSGATVSNTVDQTPASFNCGITNLGGCVLQILYTIWQASAWIARIAGQFLDFFIYYATNSSSYKNTFVEQGWAAVRDIANIFFIIALLFIAIKTVLGLNVTNNKKLIGMVVLIALVINFSLFTTKVVIDASNILAKVFYNNITSEDKNHNPTDQQNVAGEKSISVGLVDKFNPQSIVMDSYNAGLGLGYSIFIVLLLLVITLYTAYVFFSVAIYFVARVVSLWISMIFSPIAFASFALPFDIPGFGHKEWSDDLLKNAFMAPLFVFMLYIIVLFAQFLTDIVKYDSNANVGQRLMSIIIPFIIIMMLLMKAKGLVEKYSGEMGKAISNGAKLIGGAAVGVATGGTALLGRATLGRAGAAVSNSGRLKAMEAEGGVSGFMAKHLRNLGGAGAKGSFDVRGIKIAGKDLASTGLKVNAINKTQEGGFVKRRQEQVEKRQKRAKELEVGEDEGLKQNVRAAERNLNNEKTNPATQARLLELNEGIHGAAGPAGQGLGALEREATRTERALADAERVLKDTIAQFGANSIQANTARVNQTTALGDRNTARTNLDNRQTDIRTAGHGIHDAEVALKAAQNAVIGENNQRRRLYANSIQGGWSQTVNFITSGGQHSFRGEREAANKILGGIEEEKKINPHH